MNSLVVVETSPVNVEVTLSSAPTVDVSVDSTAVVEVVTGLQGPPGPAGADGGADVTYTAGENLSAYRAVRSDGANVVICDGAAGADCDDCIGLTTQAVVSGADVTVRSQGSITEGTWNWNTGPVFIGANGVLTQSVAGLAFVQPIGVAVTATSIAININRGIILA